MFNHRVWYIYIQMFSDMAVPLRKMYRDSNLLLFETTYSDHFSILMIS